MKIRFTGSKELGLYAIIKGEGYQMHTHVTDYTPQAILAEAAILRAKLEYMRQRAERLEEAAAALLTQSYNKHA